MWHERGDTCCCCGAKSGCSHSFVKCKQCIRKLCDTCCRFNDGLCGDECQHRNDKEMQEARNTAIEARVQRIEEDLYDLRNNTMEVYRSEVLGLVEGQEKLNNTLTFMSSSRNFTGASSSGGATFSLTNQSSTETTDDKIKHLAHDIAIMTREIAALKQTWKEVCQTLEERKNRKNSEEQ